MQPEKQAQHGRNKNKGTAQYRASMTTSTRLLEEVLGFLNITGTWGVVDNSHATPLFRTEVRSTSTRNIVLVIVDPYWGIVYRLNRSNSLSRTGRSEGLRGLRDPSRSGSGRLDHVEVGRG